jgi:hydroxylamine dehydrogenase
MDFKSVFIAVFLGGALIVAAALVNQQRPEADTKQPTAAFVKASGKCAQCHRRETAAIVHQFETSAHSAAGISCLDCHKVLEGQESLDHNGFNISIHPTSKNCAGCHTSEYEQYLRSRHAAPAWAAVAGRDDFTAEQLAHAEKYHPGATDRNANGLAITEGEGVRPTGCDTCHAVGRPNDDGSIGTCTHCHSRHSASIELARQPETCGQCHMGPDHSQLEIFNESKHGVLYRAQKHQFNLSAKPKELTVDDISVPNCAVCHMSGLDGLAVTHDVTERLSWYLFAPVSKKRAGYTSGQDQMKQVCTKCHSSGPIERMYENAEEVVLATNAKVEAMMAVMSGLRDDGLLTPQPFDEPIEFLEFDHWHYYGRTAKHGAFMGGADFVQWHGNYELLKVMAEIKEAADQIRERKQH